MTAGDGGPSPGGRDGGDLSGDAGDDSEAPATADGPPWPIVESATEYETGWYDGGYDRVVQPDGSEKNYYWAALPPAVVVVAIDRRGDGDEVVLVEQYRPAIRQEHLELPAGIVEDSDGPGDGPDGAERATGGGDGPDGEGGDEWPTPAAYEAAAARELEEETGVAPGETTLLQEMWCATGVLRHRRGIVLAEDLSDGQRARDTNEFLSVRRVPADEAVAVARREPTNDATVEGVLLAAAEGHLPTG